MSLRGHDTVVRGSRSPVRTMGPTWGEDGPVNPGSTLVWFFGWQLAVSVGFPGTLSAANSD